MSRLRADALLLLAALIWGTTFIAQMNGNASMGPVLFIGIKFFLAALALIPLVLHEAKKQTAKLEKRDYAVAGIIGICLFTGSALQQIGLLTTTVANAGFLTALYVVLVPFMVWLIKRHRPGFTVIVACVGSILGAQLLAENGQTRHWAAGDILVVIADLGWAGTIALVPIFLDRIPRPFLLSFIQYAITAVLGIFGGLIFEPVIFQGIKAAIPALLYAGLLCGGIAYTLQIIAQQHTPPAEAALIMSLESVFAALSGVILLQERLTPLALFGCALIFLGVVIVEAGPLFLRRSLTVEVSTEAIKSINLN